jgi:hypothetical protein
MADFFTSPDPFLSESIKKLMGILPRSCFERVFPKKKKLIICLEVVGEAILNRPKLIKIINRESRTNLM